MVISVGSGEGARPAPPAQCGCLFRLANACDALRSATSHAVTFILHRNSSVASGYRAADCNDYVLLLVLLCSARGVHAGPQPGRVRADDARAAGYLRAAPSTASTRATPACGTSPPPGRQGVTCFSSMRQGSQLRGSIRCASNKTVWYHVGNASLLTTFQMQAGCMHALHLVLDAPGKF